MPISAGIATRDITPDKALQLFGYPRTERISTGKHDPLEINALHFRTGSTGVMILSIDLLWRPVGRAVRFVLVEHPTRGRCIVTHIPHLTDLSKSAKNPFVA